MSSLSSRFSYGSHYEVLTTSQSASRLESQASVDMTHSPPHNLNPGNGTCMNRSKPRWKCLYERVKLLCYCLYDFGLPHYWILLHTLPNISRVIMSRRMRLASHVARVEEMRNAYRILVWKSEGKRPRGKPNHRWEDSIRMDLREELEVVDWFNLAQDRDQNLFLVNTIMNFGFHKRWEISWLLSDYWLLKDSGSWSQSVSQSVSQLVRWSLLEKLQSWQV
jgi:hypothetical protein